MTSFKTDPEISSARGNFLPRCNGTTSPGPGRSPIGRYVFDSVIVIAGSLSGTLFVSAMAAYVLARFQFPRRQIIFYVFMAGLMFPVFLALVPLFFLVNNLHMIGTYRG